MSKKQNDKKLFQSYIQSWVHKDLTQFLSLLSDQVNITECFGANYQNKKECRLWFTHWNNNDKNKVKEWRILHHYYDSEVDRSTFEWFFSYEYQGEALYFNGVTLFQTKNNQITELKEFEAKADLYAPYE